MIMKFLHSLMKIILTFLTFVFFFAIYVLDDLYWESSKGLGISIAGLFQKIQCCLRNKVMLKHVIKFEQYNKALKLGAQRRRFTFTLAQ